MANKFMLAVLAIAVLGALVTVIQAGPAATFEQDEDDTAADQYDLWTEPEDCQETADMACSSCCRKFGLWPANDIVSRQCRCEHGAD